MPPSELRDAFLDVPAIWSELASKLTGQREDDLKTIGVFCFIYRVPMVAAIGKVRTHVKPATDTIH